MKTRNIVLGALLLVFGLITLIFFLTVPDARFSSLVFWLALLAAVPGNLLVVVGLTLWAFSDPGPKQTKIIMMVCTSAFFGLVLLVVGAIFMYLPINDLTLEIVVFAIIEVAYALLSVYIISADEYIGKTEQVKLFVKILEADVLDCSTKTTNADTKAALLKFAENVRYSDPMSHSSLEALEGDISSVIFEISAVLSADPDADVTARLGKAEAMLSSRNNRCKLLK